MSNSYIVYFLDGPKKGETYPVQEGVSSLRVGVPFNAENEGLSYYIALRSHVTRHSKDWPEEAKISYVTYYIHEVDGKLFAFCGEGAVDFANLVAKALVEYASGLFYEAVQHLQTINNELDREYSIGSGGAIHGDVSEFLEKVRMHNE